MKKVVFLSILLASTFIFAEKNTSEPGEKFIQIVKSVLEADNLDNQKENIFPEAYVVLDGNYESIFEIFNNSGKKEKFVEKNIEIGLSHLRIMTDEENAYLVLQTKSQNKSHWHTILFHKNKENHWQIQSWHKSA